MSTKASKAAEHACTRKLQAFRTAINAVLESYGLPKGLVFYRKGGYPLYPVYAVFCGAVVSFIVYVARASTRQFAAAEFPVADAPPSATEVTAKLDHAVAALRAI